MKHAIPRRSERKYINPHIFRSYDGLVHFVNVSGLQEKRHPTEIQTFEAPDGRIIIEDRDDNIIGQFLGKNYKGKKGQIAIGGIIVGAIIIFTILTLSFIYVIFPDPTDFIVGLGWIDDALVAIASIVAAAFVLQKVIMKK